MPVLHSLFSQWGGGNRPQCVSEFAYFVILWLQSTAFDHSWGRRYATANGVVVADGESWVPISIDSVSELNVKSLGLQGVIRSWQYCLSMRCGLLSHHGFCFFMLTVHTHSWTVNAALRLKIRSELEVQLPEFRSGTQACDTTVEIVAFVPWLEPS